MISAVSVTAISAAAAGALLLWRALRGRRMDDHPVCRGCGFDLFGKPAEQTRCSECGRLVTRPRAIRIGNRQRSAMAVFFGVMALLPGLGMIGLMIAVAYAGPEMDRHKPSWWLMAELSMAGPEMRTRTLAELGNRLASGNLSASQIETVAEHALAVQANTRIAWYPPWGDFIELARATGQVSDTQWNRYLVQAVASALSLKVDPRVRRGDPIPMQIHRRPGRVGLAFSMTVVAQLTFTIDGVVVDTNRVARGWSVNLREGGIESDRIDLSPEVLARLSDGPHTLTMSCAMRITTSIDKTGDPVTQTVVELEAPVEIVPADAETMNLPRHGPPPAPGAGFHNVVAGERQR